MKTPDLEEAVFMFDLNGFVVIPGGLSKNEIQVMKSWWEQRKPGKNLFDLSFSAETPWATLLDHQSYWPMLCYLFNNDPRLDHAFGVSEGFTSAGGKLHHHANMASMGIFHTTHFGKIFVGMVGVSVALTEIEKGKGGFCCIPGSHKSLTPVPSRFLEVESNPLVIQVPQKPGDVVIFSEALTHGTYPSNQPSVRRSLLLRYTPSFCAFREPENSIVDCLPRTPNYVHEGDEGKIDRAGLTDRQADVICRAPFARGRRPSALK